MTPYFEARIFLINEMMNSKWLMIAVLLFIIISSIIYIKIPISASSYKVDEDWFKKIDSIFKKSENDTSINNNQMSLVIKHNFLFPLKNYTLVVRNLYTDDILYYDEFKHATKLHSNLENDLLEFILIDKKNTAFSFSSKGGALILKDTNKKPQEIKVTLFTTIRSKYRGRYKIEN